MTWCYSEERAERVGQDLKRCKIFSYESDVLGVFCECSLFPRESKEPSQVKSAFNVKIIRKKLVN